KLPAGVTVAPVILASDKTNLSTFSGDKQAWPVYLSIGNIDNEMRRQPSKGAMVLLGYLPVTKLLCFEPKDRPTMGYRLFHYAMSLLLQPLIEAGQMGVKMNCADGYIQHVFPILAAYIADYPEQCLISCCRQNRCPTCLVDPKERGELLDTIYYRCPSDILKEFFLMLADCSNPGLTDVNKPFWADLPHANIFRCITPDLLHQLHKGVFKDHLVKWTTAGYVVEIDNRFSRVPSYPGLRIFHRGISKVTQWTGNEFRQMQKVFLPILCGVHDDPRVITAACALMDFIFLAHYPVHSTSTLESMKQALHTFHDNKDVFIDIGVREDFNIPKFHALNHYVAAILCFGSCDGVSTEISERLHIDLAKSAYRSTNRKHYLQQMVRWLERRDKMIWFESYLRWAIPPDADNDKNGGLFPDASLSNTGTLYDDESAQVNGHISFPTYRIAKRPGMQRVTATKLREAFGAKQFTQALRTFLQTESPAVFDTLPLSAMESYDYGVYLQFRRALPSLRGLRANRDTFQDVIKAFPTSLSTANSDGTYSTVLFISDKEKAQRLGVHGYRIGQVRAIFDIPEILQSRRPHSSSPHLCYIELFTNFTEQPERYSGLYKVARMYENQERRAIIVPVESIYRSCLLVPDFGSVADLSWCSKTVLEEASMFYLTPFSDHHMYYFVT
ncbi:hypothetical protein K474DRAFT_1765035, partial [Panus rudis PR-1116 ss-1]